MGFADIDGFLDDILDKENLIGTGKVVLGGAIGGVAHGYLSGLEFFAGSDTDNTVLVKRLAAGFALAVVGAAALGSTDEDVAKGFIGGIGAQIGGMLKGRFMPAEAKAKAPATDGYGYLADSASSFVQFNGLDSARSYSGDSLPANLGRVSVGTPDPAELASLMSAF